MELEACRRTEDQSEQDWDVTDAGKARADSEPAAQWAGVKRTTWRDG